MTVGAFLLLYVGADHAAFNAAYAGDSVAKALRSVPFAPLRDLLGFMPVAALVAAWWLDRGRQHGLEPLLAVERSASPRLVGTLRAARSLLPWSVFWLSSFVRLRRAHYTTCASGSGPDTDRLRAVVGDARDRVERSLGQLKAPLLLPFSRMPRAMFAVIRRPRMIVWLVLMTPSFMWFVVGGWPQTAGLQTAMTEPGAWRVMLVLSVVAQAWLAWHVVGGVRSWPTALRRSIGDEAAMVGLRIACGVGAVGLGGYALLRVFSGLPPSGTLYAHALEAISHLTTASGQFAPGALLAFVLPAPGSLLYGSIGLAEDIAASAAADVAAGAAGTAAADVAVGASVAPVTGEAIAVTVTAAGAGVVAAGVVTGAVGAVGIPWAIEHAQEVAERPDPDLASPSGGVPPAPSEPSPPVPSFPSVPPAPETRPVPPAPSEPSTPVPFFPPVPPPPGTQPDPGYREPGMRPYYPPDAPVSPPSPPSPPSEPRPAPGTFPEQGPRRIDPSPFTEPTSPPAPRKGPEIDPRFDRRPPAASPAPAAPPSNPTRPLPDPPAPPAPGDEVPSKPSSLKAGE